MALHNPSLLQQLPIGVLELNAQGFITYLNKAVTDITGYLPDEILTKSISFLYNSDQKFKLEFELTQAAKKGIFQSESIFSKSNGQQYWGSLSISPMKRGNELLGFTATLQEITEKKEREQELQKSEERFRIMVESVKDYAIFMLDTKGYILTWNEGAKKIKGYRPDEIIGKHFSTFYIAEDLADGKPARELEIAIRTGKYEEEGWRVKKDGSVFWANVVITALFDHTNKLVGFSKVTRDLTERRTHEEFLRQSEERYRSLVEQVADYGIFMMDEKGRIISWNEGAKRIKGYAADEIIGKYFSIFYPEEDILNGKPARELKIARKEGKYEEEGWRLRKDGTSFWANVVITPVLNNDGVLIGFSKVTRDLTERKESEKALRESYEKYRQLAAELKQTNDELSYTNQELEQFTSIVSHDLQEPIRTIKSFLQLIEIKLSPSADESLKTYISKSIQAANRMKELIQNLLHYSQLSRDELIVEKVNVDELLSLSVQNLRTAAEASNATITVENSVETIYGDRVQLLQLLQNLLSNALKFTKLQEPKVNINCYKENGVIKFAVSDNGIGIASGDLQKVFEIFKRLNTDKTYPGTGIGLAICKKIVDRHQGKIWPESQQGIGTTFYFTIPAQEEIL